MAMGTVETNQYFNAQRNGPDINVLLKQWLWEQ